MVDLCEFAEMIKYPFYDEVYMKRDRRNTVTHPVTLKFDIRFQSFTTWKSFVMTFIKADNSYR